VFRERKTGVLEVFSFFFNSIKGRNNPLAWIPGENAESTCAAIKNKVLAWNHARFFGLRIKFSPY
jgi:hypothetical protein